VESAGGLLHRHVDNGPIAQGQAPIVAVVPTVKKKGRLIKASSSSMAK
jgi:hypothetical protein